MIVLLLVTTAVALGALVNSLLLSAQNDHLRARLDALRARLDALAAPKES